MRPLRREIHWNGATTAPNSSVPQVWLKARKVCEVPRSCRVTIISTAEQNAPATAISAPNEIDEVDGRMAMTTPMKPTSTADQRRQPTFSPRKIADSATTMIGADR